MVASSFPSFLFARRRTNGGRFFPPPLPLCKRACNITNAMTAAARREQRQQRMRRRPQLLTARSPSLAEKPKGTSSSSYSKRCCDTTRKNWAKCTNNYYRSSTSRNKRVTYRNNIYSSSGCSRRNRSITAFAHTRP